MPIFPLAIHAQTDSVKIHGFRHLRMPYQGDTVEILVKSVKGEEETDVGAVGIGWEDEVGEGGRKYLFRAKDLLTLK